MRRIVFILSFALLIAACKRKNDIPSDIIAPAKMQMVLWDMIRADDFVGSYLMKDTTLNKFDESNALYENIYRIHDINREKFKASLTFYREHPAILRDMMDSLIKKMAVPLPPSISPTPANVTPIKSSEIVDTSKLKTPHKIDRTIRETTIPH